MDRNSDRPLAAYLALGVGILCIGFGGIFVKLAGVPGPVSAFYRVLIAGLVIVPCWLVRPGPPPQASDFRLVLVGGLLYACDLGLWNSSLLRTSAASATLLANNAPVWVGLASCLLFGERLSKRFWMGLAIAMGGMFWMLGGDAARRFRFNTGDLLAVAASLFYAAYLLTTQKTRARVDLLTFMALSMLSSTVVLLLMNVGMGMALTGFTPRSWLSLLGLGLVSQLGGWLCINYALGHLKAAPVSVWLLGQVLVTALAAMPLLGEYPTFPQLGGGLMVLCGILLVTWSHASRNMRTADESI